MTIAPPHSAATSPPDTQTPIADPRTTLEEAGGSSATTEHKTTDAPETDLSKLPVVAVRNYGRWVASAAALVLLAMVANALLTNQRWEWDVVAEHLTWHSVLAGIWGTLRLTAVASVLGFGLGALLALMRLSASPLLRSVSWTYTWVFRSVPLLLQILLWYNLAFLYPQLTLGIPFGPEFFALDTLRIIDKFWAAILALALSQAAYSAELIRAGILSVDQGQQEAAASLGLPRGHQYRRIVLPQAMRAIVPNAVNEVIGMLKGTSIVYVIAYGELFYVVQVLMGRNLKIVPMLMVATIWYVALTTVLTIVQFYVERHFAKGAVRTLPPTPLQRLRWSSQLSWARLSGQPTPASIPASFTANSGLGRGYLTRTARKNVQ